MSPTLIVADLFLLTEHNFFLQNLTKEFINAANAKLGSISLFFNFLNFKAEVQVCNSPQYIKIADS